ncbi:carbon-nitrogen hydrolase family protein [Vibrio proteolyticus]
MERVGLIQMTSGADPEQNIDFVAAQLPGLVAQGAQWVVLPENALVFGSRADYHRHAYPLGDGPLFGAMAALARQHAIWIVVGSMPVRRAEGVSTTCVVINSLGEPVAYYDKLHMFDVDVADGHQHYRESETFTPGNQVSTTSTPFGKLGLSICYDVRFPHLYAELVDLGAQILLVPAAFTAVTGEAHWETLLRARAIETQCWVVAVNQTGTHQGGRETWGHSMVITPWGEKVTDLGRQAGTGIADIDLAQVDKLRTAMPVQQHRRFANQFQPK